jgi:poly-gamma-glutamate synthesis protein (capsule biosynthesis protein)
MPVFRSGELSAIELHPIILGYGTPPTVRGRPLLARGQLAEKIIGDLQRLSKPYGTEIVFRDGMGVVTVGATVAH